MRGAALLAVLGALLLSGCGFQLRGKASLPPEMGQTQMIIRITSYNVCYTKLLRQWQSEIPIRHG